MTAAARGQGAGHWKLNLPKADGNQESFSTALQPLWKPIGFPSQRDAGVVPAGDGAEAEETAGLCRDEQQHCELQWPAATTGEGSRAQCRSLRLELSKSWESFNRETLPAAASIEWSFQEAAPIHSPWLLKTQTPALAGTSAPNEII